MSELTRIGYLNISISDLERALDFYERRPGLEPTFCLDQPEPGGEGP